MPRRGRTRARLPPGAVKHLILTTCASSLRTQLRVFWAQRFGQFGARFITAAVGVCPQAKSPGSKITSARAALVPQPQTRSTSRRSVPSRLPHRSRRRPRRRLVRQTTDALGHELIAARLLLTDPIGRDELGHSLRVGWQRSRGSCVPTIPAGPAIGRSKKRPRPEAGTPWCSLSRRAPPNTLGTRGRCLYRCRQRTACLLRRPARRLGHREVRTLPSPGRGREASAHRLPFGNNRLPFRERARQSAPHIEMPVGGSTTGTAGSSPPDMAFAVGILVPAYAVLLPGRASTHLRWSAAHGCITAFLPVPAVAQLGD